MEVVTFKSVCCNPLKIEGHSNIRKGLRKITSWMVEQFSLAIESRVCDNCRKKVSVARNYDMSEHIASSSLEQSDSAYIHHGTALENLNDSLISVGESPIKKKRLREKAYPVKKLQTISSAIKTKILECPEMEHLESMEQDDNSQIVATLKEAFISSNKYSKKIQILTIFANNWTQQKIKEEFGPTATDWMIKKAKRLTAENGVLCSPNPKPGKSLPVDTVKLVRDFYTNEEVSRVMPGKKDCVSVKHNGKKVSVQKQLLLGNLNELYVLFKEKNPTVSIGFSKFCELRPKQCVIAGGSGTHSVCVCVHHQNVKLMVVGCRLENISGSEHPLKTYKDCLQTIMCNVPSQYCYFGECSACPSPDNLKEILVDRFSENGIEYVTYKQWTAVDRSTLETVTKTTEEFIDVFIEKLIVLRRHSFIASQQSEFFSQKKETLQRNEYLVICDFSENYFFILQDAAQGFHWNNSQATIHPFSIYYKNEQSVTCHTSLVMISDCLKHDTTAVHLFQRHLVSFLKGNFLEKPNKIIYFSDGAASQYKNRKNFSNLCYHKTDFEEISAEWHFFATSHGKSSNDGLGGTVKRLAAKASLQKPYCEQIMTPRQLFDWARKNIKGINFAYATAEDHQKEKTLLSVRFEAVRTLSGTQKLHFILPKNTTTVLTKRYSNEVTCREFSLLEVK